MTNYYKYLPVSEDDMNWGVYTVDAGKGRINLSDAYPSKDHPKHHYFSWENGRVLNEYQLIYITKGEGIFESRSCSLMKIKEGTIIMLFPEEWHRYKPNESTGWDEYWVGFNGNVIDNIVKNGFFTPRNPSMSIGFRENVLEVFLEIIERTQKEKTGYQPLISGALIYLLGIIHSISKEIYFEDKSHEEMIINKAMLFFRSNIDQDISIEKVAKEFNVSYSWFRKMFKTYTGIAPGQYLIQLKIEKAKTLLYNPALSIKEIAYELNFKSCFDFSKLFKRKTSYSPEAYRKKILFPS